MRIELQVNQLSLVANNYPGTPATLTLTGTSNQCRGWRFTAGYIIYEPGNFHFSTDASAAIAAPWPWEPATRIVNCNGATVIVSEYIADIMAQANTCCGTSNIPTQALALKNSAHTLSLDEPAAGCGTPAEFVWLALYGSNETRNMEYFFFIQLTSADGLTQIAEYFVDTALFTQTVEHKKKWPADFIGLQIGAITLVANNVVPGVNELRVRDFDGGTLQMGVEIQDTDLEQNVSIANKEFKLPDTDCVPGCTTLVWEHNDNEFGNMEILVNGQQVIMSETNEEGILYLNGGDEVTINVTGGSNVNSLVVEDSVDGELYNENDPAATYTFVAECARTYTAVGNTQGGE
jgi:hypothetical protein